MEQGSQLPPHLTLLKREAGRENPQSASDINDRSMRAYREQYWYGGNFLANYIGIEDYMGKRILEVGSAEAGLLKFFHELGARCTGMELSPLRFSHSKLLNDTSEIKLVKGDICNPDLYKESLAEGFDIIVIRDVIEHIEDKLSALTNVFNLLSEMGVFLFHSRHVTVLMPVTSRQSKTFWERSRIYICYRTLSTQLISG